MRCLLHIESKCVGLVVKAVRFTVRECRRLEMARDGHRGLVDIYRQPGVICWVRCSGELHPKPA